MGNIKVTVEKLKSNGLLKEVTKTRKKLFGNKNPMWKGNKVRYSALHNYIRWHKPKPELCEKCKKAPPFDVANISGKYTRDVNDYRWLCRKCHMTKDGRPKGKHHWNWKGGLPKCLDCGEGLSKYCGVKRCRKCWLENKKK